MYGELQPEINYYLCIKVCNNKQTVQWNLSAIFSICLQQSYLVCIALQWSALVYKSLQKSTLVCKSLRWSATVCINLQSLPSLGYNSLHWSAKICLHEFAFLGSFFWTLVLVVFPQQLETSLFWTLKCQKGETVLTTY